MHLEGVVQSIIYRNAENGWTVLELALDDMARCSVVGTLPLASVGERLSLEGQYVSHPRYGTQFKADSYSSLAPASLSAIESYLGSGLIRGVGPATARAIVAAFGMDTLRVLDDEPERIAGIPGIGKKRSVMITESYRENRVMRDIMLALEPYGVTVNQALKLYRIYGDLCMARIEENPYQIIEDVDGIGFITADKIAQNVSGFSFDSESRLKAGLLYALNQALREYGHTYLPRESLLRYAQSLLGVDERPLSDALDALLVSGGAVRQSIGGEDAIFLIAVRNMETAIAQKLLLLTQKPIDNPLLRETAFPQDARIALSHEQEAAVEAALTEGALVITGGPGTGKTTIIRFITDMMAALNLEVALTAPTGRASKRMTEATGLEAKTIHRLLEYVPGGGFTRNADNPLYYDMIIVDETSMVDVPLMHALLRAVLPGTRLVMVGDSDQLPPVGPGDVLRDIIRSGRVRTIRLTEIFRQSQRSMIVTNAHRINQGKMPVLDAGTADFVFEPIASQEVVLNRIVSLCTHPAPLLETAEPLMDIQVLAPMKKGMLGVANLNLKLQQAMNPKADGKAEWVSGETLLREGDRVMQTKNDYKVAWTKRANGAYQDGTGAFNGDLGTIYKIDAANRRILVLFDDDRLASYDIAQCDELDLAYCISIHKSQGSEFPIVILPLCGAATPLLTRNLLYTAVTRARRQVACLGRAEVIAQMVNNNRSTRRYTSLSERLNEWSGDME